MPKLIHTGESDVVIQTAFGLSPLAKNLSRFAFEHSAGQSLIGIKGVADFEISRGRKIRIWPDPKTTQKEIEIFLFGPVWATLCHQRGVLPLHASAIVSGAGIAAFAGHSGSGKSTTAASLGSLQFQLVADDILPVSFDESSTPGAWPYLRRLKLQSDSMTQLSLEPLEIVSETLDRKKYFVRPKHSADDRWRKLERLYELEIDPNESRLSIERITGAEAVRTLVDQTYHFSFVSGTGQFGNHLNFCALLASKISVYRLRRSPLAGSKELGAFIRAHLETVAP